jgi:phenylacetate-CoA ligase
VKSYVGVSVRVEVCDPGAVERSAGKATRVIDRRT